MKKLFLVSLLALQLMAGCSPASSPTSGGAGNKDEKIQVMTSFNPVDQIVKVIGGDRVETTLFVKPGTDAHSFEPTARDMTTLKKADVLFINGLDMEPWAQDGVISGSTKLITLADGVDVIMLNPAEDHQKDDGHNHASGIDPHIWLGLSELKQMAKNTASSLSLISPDDEVYFQNNLKKFNEQADFLASEFEPKFKPYAGQSFVTGHEAFAYLTRSINLVQMGVEGPFAEGEPTPQKIKELVDHVREHQISTIFVEETASPKVSETLARETGAELVTIPTMETQGEILPTIREIYEKILTALEKNL